jgi:nucleotide-binding universal stress UspA family protein
MARSLLVCIDGEPAATTLAGYVASDYDEPDVTLFHVIPYTEKRTSPSRGGRDRPEGWYEDARIRADDLFDIATDRLGDEPGLIGRAIESGDPAEEILAAADERDVDQLVLGIRQRNPTGKLVFGSAVQDVLLSTTLPVATVPLGDA